jgi:hypothetical protein
LHIEEHAILNGYVRGDGKTSNWAGTPIKFGLFIAITPNPSFMFQLLGVIMGIERYSDNYSSRCELGPAQVAHPIIGNDQPVYLKPLTRPVIPAVLVLIFCIPGTETHG